WKICRHNFVLLLSIGSKNKCFISSSACILCFFYNSYYYSWILECSSARIQMCGSHPY
ncbi:hypothetical protein ACJX0J_006059, partial [Zea mays]